jgi:hypothetical protein
MGTRRVTAVQRMVLILEILNLSLVSIPREGSEARTCSCDNCVNDLSVKPEHNISYADSLINVYNRHCQW